MNGIAEAAASLLASKSGAPFLFVGSGFSRRYLGTEDWESLLKRFCNDLQPFEYYKSTANGDLPKAASLIAQDFHHVWWKSPDYAESRAKASGHSTNVDSALKFEIARYLADLDLGKLVDESLKAEIELLREVNVDGIITTNWDLLLEDIFPEYRVFTGQDELLFSNPQAIAEIYKIHGSSQDPASLILTAEDYKDFSSKNPYLAAKLITLFIEHPIFFIGYSITDPHIQMIISSIASCLNEDKLAQFSENMIFVRRAKGIPPSVQKISFAVERGPVMATLLETDNFGDVYTAINANKRKIPARILRYCKEQMYELVKSSEPEKKLAVVSFDDLDNSKEVEFVVGVGVAASQKAQQAKYDQEVAEKLSEHGYKGVNSLELLEDVAAINSKFDADKLLSAAFPLFLKTSAVYLPIFRYLRAAGIDDYESFRKSKYKAAIAVWDKLSAKRLDVPSYRKRFIQKYDGATTSEIIAAESAEMASCYLTSQPTEIVDLEELRQFISQNKPSQFRDPYSTYFKKLVCYYDRLKYGFPMSK